MENRQRSRRSWREKLLDNRDLPKIVPIPPYMVGKWGLKEGDTMVVPSPIEVDEMMKKVPPGKLVTLVEIMKALARKHGTATCCPMTTGIFALYAARAASEAAREGETDITPYWRTLKPGGVINDRYPGGAELQKRLLEGEGHKVMKKGYKYIVVDLQESLIEL